MSSGHEGQPSSEPTVMTYDELVYPKEAHSLYKNSGT